jgi:sucrose-6F-phosphate phosphohydrolase
LGSRSLLITDLDGTLLGDDAALERFAACHESVAESVKLVYSSGRLIESMRQSVAETALPEPVAMIGGVGTEICLSNDMASLADWPPKSEAWNVARIRRILSAAAPPLELQPDEFQSEFKLSFFARDFTSDDLAAVDRLLDQAGAAARVVYSSNRDLDVLPAGVDKGSAAVEIVRRLGYSRSEAIVSGDSGNDLSMFSHGIRGIVVANAHAELKQLDGDHVYHASAAMAAGVLEGLEFWLAGDRTGSKRLARSTTR